jgi:hypothetical protein
VAKVLSILVPWRDEGDLDAALAALTVLNRWFLSRGVPPLDMTGRSVVYAREDGTEEWLTLPLIQAVGYGDCEDLAAAFAASYGGIPFVERVNQSLLHAVVRLPNGRVVDPSRILGMGRNRNGG